MTQPLDAFLAHKAGYPTVIDPTRMQHVWAKVQAQFRTPITIHIIGTNGKGSTGRFLAHFLHQAGCHVGHYTSPHIRRLGERIWCDGADADDAALEVGHRTLLALLEPQDAETLSYFEYTTLLAYWMLQECDYLVWEAGLGGEFDATSVFTRILSLITPIGYDHQEFLGETLEEITATKVRSVTYEALIAAQRYPEVLSVARTTATSRGVPLVEAEQLLTPEEYAALAAFVVRYSLAPFFLTNFTLAMAAAKKLGFALESRYWEGFAMAGRAQRLTPEIMLDVGHNPLSAAALAEALAGQKVVIVFNCLADKPVVQILTHLAPIAKQIAVIPLRTPRAIEPAQIKAACAALGLPCVPFEGIVPKERYLVYGSFYTVEAFLHAQSL